MPTIVEKSIGIGGAAAGRDYSTLQAWEDACPANLVTADQVWKGVCYNDGEFLYNGGDYGALLDFNGVTVDSTRYLWLTVASGHSIFDNIANPLRYDPTKGVGLRRGGRNTTFSNPFGNIINNATNHILIERLQVQYVVTAAPAQYTTAIRQDAGGTKTWNCFVSIINKINISSNIIGIWGYGSSIHNCTIVTELSGSETAPVLMWSTNGGPIRNCTLVARNNSNVAAVWTAYGSNTITNCAIFGCRILTTNGPTPSVSSSNNITDGPFVIPGTNNQYGARFLDCFNSYQDLRPKKDSPLTYGGTYLSAVSTDPYGIVRTPGLVSIGAIQYVETGKIPYQKKTANLSELNWSNPILSSINTTRLGVAAVADNRGTKYIRFGGVISPTTNITNLNNKVYGSFPNFGVNINTTTPIWGSQFGGGNHSVVVDFIGPSTTNAVILELFNGNVADRPLYITTDASASLVVTSSGQTIISAGTLLILPGVQYTLIATVSGTTWNIWINKIKIIDNVTVANSNGRETGNIPVSTNVGNIILVRNYIFNNNEVNQLFNDPYQFFKRVNPINTRIFEKQLIKTTPVVFTPTKTIETPILVESNLTRSLNSGILPDTRYIRSNTTKRFYNPVLPNSIITSTNSISSTPYGPSIYSAHADNYVSTSSFKYNTSTSSPSCLLAVFSLNSSPNNNKRAVASTRNAMGGWNAQVIAIGNGSSPIIRSTALLSSTSPGSAGFGADDSNINSNIIVVPNKLYCVAACYVPGQSHSLAINGMLVSRISATSNFFVNADRLSAGGEAYGDIGGTYPINLHMALLWSSNLTDDKLIEITDNPWKLFNPKHITYFLPSSLNRSPIKVKRDILSEQPQEITDIDWSNPLTNKLVSSLELTSGSVKDFASSLRFNHSIPIVGTKVGLAPNFSGTGISTGVTSINGQNLFATPTNPFSVMVLYKLTTNTGGGTIFARCSASTDQTLRTFQILYNFTVTGAQVGANIRGGSVNAPFVAAYGTEGNKDWHLYTVSFNGGTSAAEFFDTFASSVPIGSAPEETTELIRIGSRASDTGFPMTGQVAFVRIWSRALSRVEHLKLYENPWQIFKSKPQIYIQSPLPREIGKPIPMLKDPPYRTSQPRVPVGVNRANPITRDLRVLVNAPLGINEVNSRRCSTYGVSTNFITRGARGSNFLSPRDSWARIYSRDIASETSTDDYTLTNLSGDKGTLLVFGCMHNFVAGQIDLVRVQDNADNGFISLGEASNNAINIRGGADINLGGGTSPRIYIGVADGTTLFGYRSGSLIGSATITARNFANVTSLRHSPWGYVNGSIIISAFWNRALTYGEVKSLSDNPWQLFNQFEEHHNVDFIPTIQTVLKKLRRRIMLIS